MKEKSSKSLQYYMRVLHRDLGFLALGMVVIYALSGIVLIHRNGNFMKTSTPVEMTVAPNLGEKELGEALKFKKFQVKEEKDGIIYFAEGQYDKKSGKASFVKSELIFPFNKFANLHKVPCAQNPHVGWFTTLFGIVLFFLAISSLFMFKTNAKQFKANMIYTAVGIIISVILIALL